MVGDATLKERAATPPKDTTVTSVKFVPMIVTRSPPAVEPLLTLREVMAGNAPAGVMMKSSVGEISDVPVGVVTMTSSVVADASCVGHAGTTAVMVPSALTVKDAA